jgi:hypothetical protein
MRSPLTPLPPPQTPHAHAASAAPTTLDDLLTLDRKPDAAPAEKKEQQPAAAAAAPAAAPAAQPAAVAANEAATAAPAPADAEPTASELDAAFGPALQAFKGLGLPAGGAASAAPAAATAAPATTTNTAAAAPPQPRTVSDDGRPLCPDTPSAIYQCVPPGFTPDAAPDLKACVDLCAGPPAPPLPVVEGVDAAASATPAPTQAAALCLPCGDPGAACKKAHGEFGNAFTFALVSRGAAPCYVPPPPPAVGDPSCKNEGSNNVGCGNVGDNNRVRWADCCVWVWTHRACLLFHSLTKERNLPPCLSSPTGQQQPRQRQPGRRQRGQLQCGRQECGELQPGQLQPRGRQQRALCGWVGGWEWGGE